MNIQKRSMESYCKTFSTIMLIGSIFISFAQTTFARQKELVSSLALEVFLSSRR